MLRSVLVVFAGLIVGMLMVTAIESMIPLVFALPPLDVADPAAVKAAMASLPAGVFVMLMFGWAFGALTGGLVSARLATHTSGRGPLGHALAVGLVQTAGAIANFSMLPHPTWVIAAGLVLFVPMALLGGHLGRRPGAV